VRFRLQIWLTSAITYAIYTAILFVHVALDLAPLGAVLVLAGISVGVNAIFYVGIRMRWDKRIKDDRMTVIQLVTGLLTMLINYTQIGMASGATIIIMASHLIYALFTFNTRQVWGFLLFSLGCLAATMGLCHWMDPIRYPANLQISAFMYACVVLAVIARLATRVSYMTARYRSHREELNAALAKVRELATRDELTQVHNRRHMVDLMRMEQVRHERSGAPFCLALIDIDLFKNVNDKFGHHAGDEVLRRFASITKASLRGADLLGRWGGEEFVVMFTETPVEQARTALQRLREQLAQTSFDDIAPGLRVTFSAGLLPLDVRERLESSIARADQAMYRAKTLGRDRVELAAPVDAASLAELTA
jgi:diguanylate cyclase (GGDEF)-like protein